MQNYCVALRKCWHHLWFGKTTLPANCWWLFALFLWGLALCLRALWSDQQKKHPRDICLWEQVHLCEVSFSSHRSLLYSTLSKGKKGVWKRCQHCCEQGGSSEWGISEWGVSAQAEKTDAPRAAGKVAKGLGTPKGWKHGAFLPTQTREEKSSFQTAEMWIFNISFPLKLFKSIL